MTGSEPRDEEQRRHRISARIQRWCADAALTGRPVDLSDSAALHIAAGRAGADIAQVVLVRVRAGLPTPVLGAADLREMADRVRTYDTADRRRAGGRARWNPIADEHRRRLRVRRGQAVEKLVAYPTGLRRQHRERRDGVFLGLEQREQLFEMLCWTPAPTVARRGMFGGAGADLLSGLAETAAERLPAGSTAHTVADRVGRRGDRAPHLTFRDGYDTLLYLAGRYRDRIVADPVWHSAMFDVQRAGIDFARELVDLATDATELHRITARLTAATGSPDEQVRASVTARLAALDGVWEQLVERVAALARIDDALITVGEQMRAVEQLHHTRSFDDRIDELVLRAGAAETTARIHRDIGEEVEAGGAGYARFQRAVAREIEQLGRGRA